MISTEDEARAYCAQRLDVSAMVRLERYVQLLGEENEKQNLVSPRSLLHVWQRHIVDSLQLLEHVSRGTEPWLDLGTGAGPPGLIVAIARPVLVIRLVESRRRRAEWLTSVAADLGLEHCQVVGDRLEDVPASPTGTISARAFAPLDRLLRLAARFSTPETIWLLPKGRSAAKELGEQEPAIRAMFHVEPSLTDAEAGLLIGRGRPPGV